MLDLFKSYEYLPFWLRELISFLGIMGSIGVIFILMIYVFPA